MLLRGDRLVKPASGAATAFCPNLHVPAELHDSRSSMARWQQHRSWRWVQRCSLAALLAPSASLAIGVCFRPAAVRAAPTGSKPEPRVVAKSYQRTLTQLAHQLLDRDERVQQAAYRRLKATAARWPTPWRSRAALALGYYEYRHRQFAEARRHFQQASQDVLLAEYALYWEGQAAVAGGDATAALTLLEQFLRKYAESVLRPQALVAYAQAGLAAGQPQRVIQQLRAESATPTSPGLLLALAQAEQQVGEVVAAARDFQQVYYRFPLSPPAETAAGALSTLQHQLGPSFPAVSVADRVFRAEQLYAAGRYQQALAEWEQLDRLQVDDRELVRLRVAECRSRLERTDEPLRTLVLVDPERDAERWAALVAFYRAAGDQSRMLAALDQIRARHLRGHWAMRAFFDAAGAFWSQMEFSQAEELYAQAAALDPAAPEAAIADWRVAWATYVAGRAAAEEHFRQHLEKYPRSPFAPDALYWWGRWLEQQHRAADARVCYAKLRERFPGSYWAGQAELRLHRLRARGDRVSLLLPELPPLPPLPALNGSLPARLQPLWQKAQALRSVGFEQSAYLELTRAYREVPVPVLLLEAARAIQAAGRYMTAARLVRELVPELEARPLGTVHEEWWRLVYPFPYQREIRRAARRAGLDPYLVAALIRQESGFDPESVSSAGAVGLMQLMPPTARRWSQKLHLRFRPIWLQQVNYNLRLGCAYLASLLRQYAEPEVALAAYNAGENRVAAWQAARTFDDRAEFVESIPYRQTQAYVETVISTAKIYRALYGSRQ